MYKKMSVIVLTIVVGTVSLFAQNPQLRAAVAGQKYKMKGVIVSKQNETTFILRDSLSVDTKIVVSPGANIKSNGFLGGDKYPATALVR